MTAIEKLPAASREERKKGFDAFQRKGRPPMKNRSSKKSLKQKLTIALSVVNALNVRT